MTWKIIVDSDCCDFIWYWDYTKCNHIDSKTGICCEKHCPTKTLEKLKQKLIEDCDEILKNCDEEDYYSGYFYATKDFKIAIEKRFGD